MDLKVAAVGRNLGEFEEFTDEGGVVIVDDMEYVLDHVPYYN